MLYDMKRTRICLPTKEETKMRRALYLRWRNMLERCTCPWHFAYKFYGARGITLCRRWRNFNFFFADMGYPPFKGASIDRKNGFKGYSKSNCRWATAIEQGRNKCIPVRTVLFKGKIQYVADVAKQLGISYSALHARLFQMKWPLKRAFSRILIKTYAQRIHAAR
jgi:hypothetical protein